MKVWMVSGLMIVLVACTPGRQIGFGKPYTLDITPPAGSALFQQGWREGCETGLSMMGNQFNKLFHSFQYRPEFSNKKEYERSWNAGNLYCRVFTYTAHMHGKGNFGYAY